jgi:Protein of unknown function (DUF2934)
VASDDGTSAVGEEAKQIIRERAHALWEADGRPEGRELAYWLRAEQELLAALVAGEEDPYVGLDDGEPGTDRDWGAAA